MADAIGNQATEKCCETVSKEPSGLTDMTFSENIAKHLRLGHSPEWLFVAFPVHTSNQSETRCNSRFSDAQKKASGHQVGEVLTGGVTHEDATPDRDT